MKASIHFYHCALWLIMSIPKIHAGSFSATATSMPGLGTIGTLSKTQLTDQFGGKQAISASDKYTSPQGITIGMNRGLTSFTKHHTKLHHPQASALFDDAALSQSLAAFLQAVEKDSYFLVFFSKIHLTMLHELYTYLTKIYATFAMTHVDDMNTYLTLDQKTALTRKTIIINHLINIIEAQSNQAIRARFPSLPKNIATYAGTLMMKHDYGSDLSLMLDKSETQFITSPEGQAMVANVRSSYLTLYGNYLAFFHRYTQSLSTMIMNKGYISGNAFVDHAARIATVINNFSPPLGTCTDLKQQIAQLRATQRINPPLFFYDQQTMRGLKIIPILAQELPPNVQSVGLPEQSVKNATQKVMATTVYGNQLGYPRAFFNGTRLFINIPLAQPVNQAGPQVYAQELMAQPAWLNSSKGVLAMLAACLGDFTALLDPVFADDYILDPCIECITRNAAATVNLGTHDQGACQACSLFISTISKKIEQESQSVSLPPIGPDGGDAAPPPPGL